jgi:hypothetical protein
VEVPLAGIIFGAMLEHEHHGFEVPYLVWEVSTDVPNTPHLAYNVERVGHGMKMFDHYQFIGFICQVLRDFLVHIDLHDIGEWCDELLQKRIQEATLLLVLLQDMTEAVLDLLEWKVVELRDLLLFKHVAAVLQVEVGAHVLDVIEEGLVFDHQHLIDGH